VSAALLELEAVQPGAHLDAERLHRVADRHRAANRSLRTVEHREEAVSRRVHLAASKPSELRPSDDVVRINNACQSRSPISAPSRAVRRSHGA
jgi:hypothetical protein